MIILRMDIQLRGDMFFSNPSSNPSANRSHPQKNKRAVGKKFEYDWSVSIEPGILPDPTQTKLKLCVFSKCFLYGISSNQIKRCAKKMKTYNSSDIKSARL